MNEEFNVSDVELLCKFKEGHRNYSCHIKGLPENLLDVECSKCHVLCKHLLDLAHHYLSHRLSILLFDTLWLYNEVSHKTFTKAWNAIQKTYIQNVEPNVLSAIVDGNGDVYTVIFEDKKKYCSCIYGKSNKGMCYHQVATLLSSILQKRLTTLEAKSLL